MSPLCFRSFYMGGVTSGFVFSSSTFFPKFVFMNRLNTMHQRKNMGSVKQIKIISSRKMKSDVLQMDYVTYMYTQHICSIREGDPHNIWCFNNTVAIAIKSE